MKNTHGKSYSLFTGCLIPSKFPFIEKASRMVLEHLGIALHTIKEASCCPNQMAVKSSDKDLWYALAARNLCLAEDSGFDILSLCNGCYDTLKTVNSRLKSDGKFRNRINEMLKDYNLSFRGTIDVKHVVQVLLDDIGANALEKKVTFPLKGIGCAPFTGCHVRRPADHMGFDDPVNPSYLKKLVAVLGGETVSYPEEYSCCGGGLSIGRKDDVVPAARRILRSAQSAGAEVLVVNCPFCFAQFFRGEREIKDIYFEDLGLPVLYITQLMGLAFGMDPKELEMPLHYANSVGNEEGLVERITGQMPDASAFEDEVTREQLILCAKCGACVDDCPTAMTTSEYRPDELLELILEGKIEQAVSREDIWFCMNCHECTQLCPQGFGMVKLILRLKNMASDVGKYPEVVGHRISGLHECGYSFSPDKETREEMDLPKITLPEITKLRKLMEDAKVEDKDEGGS